MEALKNVAGAELGEGGWWRLASPRGSGKRVTGVRPDTRRMVEEGGQPQISKEWWPEP